MQLNPSDLNFVAAGLRLVAKKQAKLAANHPTRRHLEELLDRVEAEILANWQDTKIEEETS